MSVVGPRVVSGATRLPLYSPSRSVDDWAVASVLPFESTSLTLTCEPVRGVVFRSLVATVLIWATVPLKCRKRRSQLLTIRQVVVLKVWMRVLGRSSRPQTGLHKRGWALRIGRRLLRVIVLR